MPSVPAVVPAAPGSSAPLQAMPSSPPDCAAAPADVIAAGSPELIAWWLSCDGRTVDDVATLAAVLLDAGREDDAAAILALLDEG